MNGNRTRGLLGAAVVLVLSGSFVHAGDCAPPPPPPCGPAYGGPAYGGPTTQKVWVTRYVPKQFEETRTFYKTEYKEEKYTAYKCVSEPQEKTRQVTYSKMVPVERDVEVTRHVYAPKEEARDITRHV